MHLPNTIRTPFFFTCVLFLNVLSLAGITAAESSIENPQDVVAAKIDPLVESQTQSGTLSQFMVVFHEQADLSGAQRLQSKPEKTRYVFETLKVTASKSQSEIKLDLESQGFSVKSFYIVNELLVQSQPGSANIVTSLNTLATNPSVEKIIPVLPAFIPESQSLRKLRSRRARTNVNIRFIGGRALHRRGIKGKGIVVGIADTGADFTHEALATKYRGKNGNHDYNWFDPSADPSLVPIDTNGHGTHVTGIAVGSARGRKIGVAPKAKWIHCRGLGLGASRETVLSCLQFFLAPTRVDGSDPNPNKAPDVINNSYICPFCSLETAFANLTAAGIFSVGVTGNFGPTCGSVFDPGTYAQLFTVGATRAGKLSKISSFSSRSDPSDSFIKPEIVAPGLEILSAAPGNLYATSSGTSMAAPHVTGAVALLWSARPELQGRIRKTKKILTASAHPRTDKRCSQDEAFPGNVYGFGFIDLRAALAK